MNKQTLFKYLIECLLIFISVIAAFLFDNERERRQFEQQELDLLREVTTDLVNDSIEYNRRINQATKLSNQLTKLIRALESKSKGDSIDVNTFFKPIEIVLNKTTYDVIKSTGGFKFILNKELVAGLSDYYNSREYISEIYSRLNLEVDTRIGELLTAETRYVDNNQPQSSYLLFSHTIDPQSLNGLKGNQKLINLCYMRRTLLDQLISVFKNFLKVKSKKLHGECQSYLQLKS